MAKPNAEAVERGVAEAWDFWLSQHPISVPDMVEKAISEAVTAWLDAHVDEVLEMIADRYGARQP